MIVVFLPLKISYLNDHSPPQTVIFLSILCKPSNKVDSTRCYKLKRLLELIKVSLM